MAAIPKGKAHKAWQVAKKTAQKEDAEGFAAVSKAFKKDLGPTLDKFDKAVEKDKDTDIKKYAKEVQAILDDYKKALVKNKEDMGKAFNTLNFFLSGLQAYVEEYSA
jgi:molecular chaperone GrpE (heat shock protein)